jgi:predicted transcriptional regulator
MDPATIRLPTSVGTVGDIEDTPDNVGDHDSDSDGDIEEKIDDVRELLKAKTGKELTKGLFDTVCEEARNNPEKVFIVLQALQEAQKEMIKRDF